MSINKTQHLHKACCLFECKGLVDEEACWCPAEGCACWALGAEHSAFWGLSWARLAVYGMVVPLDGGI